MGNELIQTLTPETLPDLFYKDQSVITSEIMAVLFGTDVNNIKSNFTYSKKRFDEGRHYFKLTGQDLNSFRSFVSQMNLQVRNFDLQISNKTRSLMLWTERGTARHAKMLNNDQAWRVFEKLEDAYFNRVPFGVVKGSGPASKEQKLTRITTVFSNAKRLSREAGLRGDDAVLKANEITVKTIGIDVFKSFDIPAPKPRAQPDDYPDDVRVFFETMDQLLTEDQVKDHGSKIDIVWIHMPTTLETIEKEIGRSFNRGILYQQVKRSDRFVDQKDGFRSRIFKKPIRAWAFKKQGRNSP